MWLTSNSMTKRTFSLGRALPRALAQVLEYLQEETRMLGFETNLRE